MIKHLMKLKKIPKYLVLVFFGLLVLFPIYIVLVGSFKTENQLYDNIFGLPESLSPDNYIKAFFDGGLINYYQNSIIVTVFSLALIVVLSSMAAFALTRKNIKGGKLIYLLFIIGIVIPPQVAIIQLSLQMNKMGLTNSLRGLIAVYVAYGLSFSVFILYGFMKDISKEIQEAAIVDGCSNFRMYSRIIMPLSKAPVATVLIFNLVTIWNDMIFPLVLISKNDLRTLPYGLLRFKGLYTSQYSVIFAGVILISIPLVVFYLILQKQFIRGMAQGAVKG